MIAIDLIAQDLKQFVVEHFHSQFLKKLEDSLEYPWHLVHNTVTSRLHFSLLLSCEFF